MKEQTQILISTVISYGMRALILSLFCCLAGIMMISCIRGNLLPRTGVFANHQSLFAMDEETPYCTPLATEAAECAFSGRR